MNKYLQTLEPPKSSRFILFIISTLLSCNFIFYVLYKASDHFTGFGFNESVIYHVFYGIQGFDISLYLEIIIGLCIVIILFTYISFKLPKKLIKHPYHYASAIFLTGLLWFQPLTNNLFTLFGASMFNRSFIGDLHPVINQNITLNSNKNIVYIYAESLEQTYLDNSLFPNLTPNLNRLKKQGIFFKNIHQTYGSGGTMAGMIASQCAVPFDAYGIVDKSKPFLPSLYCLGDILSENHYNLTYIGGASLKFAGKGNFYKSHSFDTVLGKEQLLPLQEDKEYVSHWGLHDDFTFKQVMLEYQHLQSLNQRFGLFTLTLDTHHPDYQMSKICGQHQYKDGSNHRLNAIHCSDFQIGQLVDKILIDPDTLIIVSSDHLSPNTKLFKSKIDSKNRSNLLIVLNSDQTPKTVSKIGATIDTLPTILSFLGSNIHHHNLGVNLLSDQLSLFEEDAQLNKKLLGWTHQLRKFN